MRNEIEREHCSSYENYKAFYEEQALRSNLTTTRKGTRMKPISWVVRKILNSKAPPCKVLDVGPQHGTVELILAALWYDVTAIDVSERYIKASKRNTLVLNEYIDYRLLPVERAWELGKAFQVIIGLSILEHVMDFDRAFNGMLEVADIGALMLFTVPIEKSWLSEEHTRIFTDENIYDYFPKEAEVSKIRFSDDPKQLGWYAVRYIKR